MGINLATIGGKATIVEYSVSRTKSEHWNKMGHYFGYPQCCIDDFTAFARGEVKERTRYQMEFFRNAHGFIPCPSCAQKVLTGALTMNELLKHRQCPTAFPEES